MTPAKQKTMKKEKLTIVKIGGHVVDDKEKLDKFLDQFSKLDGKKILIHGGGKRLLMFYKAWVYNPKWLMVAE